MKKFLIIIFLAFNLPTIATPTPIAPVNSLLVVIKKVAKLPDAQQKIEMPAGQFLDFYNKKQSPETVASCANESLKALFVNLSSKIEELSKIRTARKTIFHTTTITLPEDFFTFCVKCTLKKDGSEIHVTISAFVPTATDTEMITAITHFCNAQIHELSLIQKYKKTFAACIIIPPAVAVGYLAQKVIDRRREEAAFKKKISGQSEFKRYLTTTPFIFFTQSPNYSGTFDEIELPDKNAPARFVAQSIKCLIPDYFYGESQRTINGYGFGETTQLTNEQLKELVMGCFKESTIDLLGQFQEDYMIALAKDGNDDDKITHKTAELLKLVGKLKELNKTDPVEVKRILLFKPTTMYLRLIAQNFYRKNEHCWQTIITTAAPYLIQTPIFPFCKLNTTFCDVLKECLRAKYCLKDHFPRDFAMFKDLHTVSTTGKSANPTSKN